MGLFDFLKKEDRTLDRILSDDLVTPTQIRTNLEDVCRKNVHLVTTIDERQRTFGSIFIEVGKGNDFVMIDVLIPSDGNRIIETSDKVRIDYNIEGVMYYFETKFIGMVSGRLPSIKIAFPSIIKKVQKRSAFRVSPSIEHPIIVEVKEGAAEETADISEGGLAFFTRHTEKEMGVGTVFEKMSFKLPGMDRQITAKAVVRSFIKGFHGAVRNRCGVEFIGMRMQDKDSIAHYILLRQREIVQKQLGS